MEIMDTNEDDIYATNYLSSSIDSIRHRTPTIYAEGTPWKHRHTAGTEAQGQTKPTAKTDYLRVVLRPRKWTPSLGAYHNTSKLNKSTSRYGPLIPSMANIRGLKTRACGRDLLARMMTPSQVSLRDKHLWTLCGPAHKIDNDILDLNPEGRRHINGADKDPAPTP